MDDLGVIDRFLTEFIRYIDGGFGLLGGDVRFLTATLIGIDITLAGLFWAMGAEDIHARLIRKILFVGAFAFILGSFPTLADIVFRSFAEVGLKAGGGTMSADDLLRPGRLASTGFTAAWPLLDQIAKLLGFATFFDNFLTIAVLLFAWAIVIVAFFALAVQLFVCLIEFKLTSLAGFVLVPFALWGRTSFLAERVLGNVVASGVKVMVLAVIVGIGSGFFAEFAQALQGREPDIGEAMSLVLASLALFGLGIFGPGIAGGLVAGAPQLGAGAAFGTALGTAGLTMVAGGAVAGAARSVGGAFEAIRAGTAINSAAPLAAASVPGAAPSGPAAGATAAPLTPVGSAMSAGQRPGASGGGASGREAVPAWAAAMRREQTARHHRHIAVQALREGDRGGGGASPNIKED